LSEGVLVSDTAEGVFPQIPTTNKTDSFTYLRVGFLLAVEGVLHEVPAFVLVKTELNAVTTRRGFIFFQP
jgi:hypothetical protein